MKASNVVEKKVKATYTGEFKDGWFHGQGTYISELDEYTAEWVKGEWHGYGESFNKISKVTFKGEWNKNQKVKGTNVSRWGTYVGEFKNGLYHGKGKFEDLYGNTKEGFFENGKYIGE